MILLILLILVYLFLQIFKTSSKYPELEQLTYNLQNELPLIQKEVLSVINNKPKFSERRQPGKWSGKEGNKYAQSLKNKDGWTEDDNWINYPIIYDGEFFEYAEKSLPQLCHHLQKVSHKIHVAGLSLLKPYGKIKPHVDENEITYHFNIKCPEQGKSIIKIGEQEIEQKTGYSLIFNARTTHSVNNFSPQNRTILYIDFGKK